MRTFIKHMVCPVHLYFVRLELENLGISYKNLVMGEVNLPTDISEDTLEQLEIALSPYGFRLEYDERSKVILKIKTAIAQYLDNPETETKIELSQYLVHKVMRTIYYINLIFKEETGTTIERYFMSKKIGKAIELLVHYNLTLTEIAYQLNYSSEEELINQFKTITGQMPERFKKQKQKKQIMHERLIA